MWFVPGKVLCNTNFIFIPAYLYPTRGTPPSEPEGRVKLLKLLKIDFLFDQVTKTTLPWKQMEETGLDVGVGAVEDGRVDVIQAESYARRDELFENSTHLLDDQHQQL